MINLQNPETGPKATKAKIKSENTDKPSPFAQARAIFWKDPKQDRATFLAACEAIGMNPATAKTRWYCLTTDRDASCKDPTLRGV
jgi:hypothetical protein